jgi:hypothetical protein
VSACGKEKPRGPARCPPESRRAPRGETKRLRTVRDQARPSIDAPEAILAGASELPAAIVQANGIATEDIASAFLAGAC